MNPRHPEFDPAEDARLVQGCLRGDARAWEALVRRHERLVYAVTRSYRLSEEDTGDVFQEVFAALVQGLPRLRDARALVRWISSTADRIARATAYRRRREQARSSSHPVTLELLRDPGVPVGADLERLEDEAMVRLAFSAIGLRCRKLLGALYYSADEPPTYTELARRLGIPLGSLGPTRARCLRRLRERFEEMSRERGIKSQPSATSAPAPGKPPGHVRAASARLSPRRAGRSPQRTR